MSNLFIGLGALGCLLAVATGAFGAHALKQVLDADMLAVWHTAVQYLFFHALGLILIGVLQNSSQRHCHKIAGAFMLAGIALFSGSLFVLSLSGLKWLGMITPFGGVCFLAAWLILALGYLTKQHSESE
jgi:uncharacterized membrane protein YgdD (TMEM256/DUF423 family)